MVGGQCAAEVQPVRTGQDAGDNLGVIVPAACAVTAALAGAGLATVVLAQGVGDGTLSDAPSPARPVEQVAPVQVGQPRRDLPAGRSGFPARELVQAAQRAADVLIGDQPALGVRRRAALVPPGAGRRSLAGQDSEPLPFLWRGPRERDVKELLRFRSRPEAWFLVLVPDGARADVQVPSEGVVAHPERGLQRGRGAPGPAGHHVHRPPAAGRTELTAPEQRPARVPGVPGRAQARSVARRTPAGFTGIGVLPVPFGRSPVANSVPDFSR
jgi:hypothetical protein